MWKKDEPGSTEPTRSEPISPAPSRPRAEKTTAAATIGPSITIQGDIHGDEDLLIEGKVSGSIQLRQNNVTIGPNGRVEADIHGKRICVDGQVKGDLIGEEVVIRQAGKVEGNATAPRVTLENGCNFRGSIDMQPAKQPAKESPKVSARTQAAIAARRGAPQAAPA